MRCARPEKGGTRPGGAVPAGDVIVVGMVLITRPFAGEQGHARFEDFEVSLAPGTVPPYGMSASWPGVA